MLVSLVVVDHEVCRGVECLVCCVVGRGPHTAAVRARLLAREDGVVAAAALIVRALLARDRHYNSRD